MGGMMSYKLACTITDKIAAIGSHSGYPLGDMSPNSCSPSRPVPVCHTHGVSDNFVAYSGVKTYLEKFIKSNDCSGTPTVTTFPKCKKEYWGPCEKGSGIAFYSVNGLSHEYPSASSGFSPSDTFWTFFKKHPGTTGAKHVVVNKPQKEIFSVRYSEGFIHLQGDQSVTAIRICDIQGKVSISLNAQYSKDGSLNIPVGKKLAGGMYLIGISGYGFNSINSYIFHEFLKIKQNKTKQNKTKQNKTK
jgi:hypothetical protein